MKQHITVEQLNELSDKGKERLAKWVNPVYDTIRIENIKTGEVAHVPTKYNLPLLSIGQMIEFLYENSSLKLEWPSILKFTGNNKDGIAYKGTPLLCDDLWQACKEVLEQESNNS